MKKTTYNAHIVRRERDNEALSIVIHSQVLWFSEIHEVLKKADIINNHHTDYFLDGCSQEEFDFIRCFNLMPIIEIKDESSNFNTRFTYQKNLHPRKNVVVSKKFHNRVILN